MNCIELVCATSLDVSMLIPVISVEDGRDWLLWKIEWEIGMLMEFLVSRMHSFEVVKLLTSPELN
jgi:hypothetical protein